MRYLWLLLVACLASTGHATEIYQYVDEHGNRIFTDKPPVHVDAEKISLPEVNRTQMPSPAAPSGASQAPSADDGASAPLTGNWPLPSCPSMRPSGPMTAT